LYWGDILKTLGIIGAIGHVAYINCIPFVIIRSISDNADDDASITYDEFEQIASHNSANIVLKMLELS